MSKENSEGKSLCRVWFLSSSLAPESRTTVVYMVILAS